MNRFKHLLSLVLLCLSVTGLAQVNQSTGIHFFKGSWKALMDEAAKQNKLIFVDVYTDWCAPCKTMDQEVFPSQEVGKEYNNLFVSYKLNAEKGEGIVLSKHYAVRAYPTYLFLDKNGNLIDRSGDYMQASEFIAVGKKAAASKNESGSLAELDAQFRKGDRRPDFLKAYLEKRTVLKMDNAEVLNAYVTVLSPQMLKQPKTLIFLTHHMGGTTSKALPVVLNGLKYLSVAQKTDVADQLFNDMLYTTLGTAIKEKNEAEAKKAFADVKRIQPLLSRKYEPTVENLELYYYGLIKDIAGLKAIGYKIAAKQMAISTDSLRKKDRMLFDQIMQPFFNGKMDSTKFAGYAEERKLAAVQYSAATATALYTVSNAFKNMLNAKDKGLDDALIWAQWAYRIYPNENILKLVEQLKKTTK